VLILRDGLFKYSFPACETHLPQERSFSMPTPQKCFTLSMVTYVFVIVRLRSVLATCWLLESTIHDRRLIFNLSKSVTATFSQIIQVVTYAHNESLRVSLSGVKKWWAKRCLR